MSTYFHTPLGSRHVKGFRSPAEFAPHALWLLNDPSLQNCNCLCKYCDKKPTRTMKRSESITPGLIVPPSSSRSRRVAKTSSSLSHTSRPSVGKEAKRLFRATKIPIGSDPGDFQPTLSDTGTGSLYREEEIVWLILNEPVMLDYADGAADGFIIRFWPSIIDIAGQHGSTPATLCEHGTSTVTLLRVRLFSSGITYDVPQHCTLPFWSHSPDELWLQRLRLQTHKSLHGVLDPFSGFARVFGNLSREEATLALNTGDILSHFLSDISTSLELARSWSATPTTHPSRPGGSFTPTRPSIPTTPTPYRELWWGAEQIVLGDLIRLKIPESMLPKLGVNQVRSPSHPFSEPPAEATSAGDSETEDRQLFLKLRSLETVVGIDGKELHGFGGLYHLLPATPGPLPPLVDDTGLRQSGLPRPPEGFTFQPVLCSGWEIELSLHHLDGRYYPRIQELLPDPSGVDAHVLEVLEGVVCWRALPLRPRYFKRGSRNEVVARIVGESRKLTEGRSS